MEHLFADGRMIDVALAVLASEMLVLFFWSRQRPAWASFLPTMMSGLMLMLAWRFTQAGLAWPWIAAPLLASGLAHASDLWLRWPNNTPEGFSPQPHVAASD
jgi:hypothetical protein